MSGDVAVEEREVAATPIAATRRRVAWDELASQIGVMFDAIYAVKPPRPPGAHNVIVYRELDDHGALVECGVVTDASFTGAGAIERSALPAGRALVTVHRGRYGGIPATHDALAAWARAHGRVTSGVRWEIYGDWSDDPAQLETTLFQLLR